MAVSVVIPAYNAAATLAETLQSLREQTFTNWEGIVVDDGSSDSTTDIAERHVSADSRFRLISQQRKGVSAARNAGIEVARFDWLLFLDADDWILPDYLQQMTALLGSDADLDAAVCGWAHVTPDGEFVFEQYGGLTGDLFAAHAQYCYSVIHTYVVRRSLVNSVGGFDASLRTCEDWDFFQRIARTGARFGGVPHTLAAYRMRAGSATTNGLQLFADGSQVLTQGHTRDRRITTAHPLHAEGLPPRELPAHVYGLACACAGYLLGSGGDVQALLDKLPDEQQPDLDAYGVAQAIFIHAMAGAALPRSQWQQLWETRRPDIGAFLRRLELQSGSRGIESKACMYGDFLDARYAPRAGKRIPAITGRLHRGHDLLVSRGRENKRLAVRLWSVLKSMAPDVERRASATKEFMKSRLRQSDSRAALDRHRHFETLFQTDPDPWEYSNDFEQLKYQQTIALLPDVPIEKALELACAEGHFTELLAPRVGRLTANDISESAIQHARERCGNLDNIEFQCFDFLQQPIRGSFDLIVCSEVLYYVGTVTTLKRFAEQLVKNLNVGGHLVMAHSNAVCDEPEKPGFDWEHDFGARAIGEIFSTVAGLHLVTEGRSQLYRIHVFKRVEASARPDRPDSPEVVNLSLPDPLPARIADQVQWVSSRYLCILNYSTVGERADGAGGRSPVAFSDFEEQLRYLSENHFRSVTLGDWSRASSHGVALAGRPVFPVFDDVAPDFSADALPLLQRHGFQATVLLTIDPQTKRVYRSPGSTRELSWKEIRRLQSNAVAFGVRPAATESLASLSLAAARERIKSSRIAVESELGEPVRLFVYPGGISSRRLQFLAGISGFDFALSARRGVCAANHSLLALPSITVAGSDSMAEFKAKLSGSENLRV